MRSYRSLLFIISCLLFSLSVKAQSYSINGNTLITTDKVQITIGSFIRYVKPYNNKPNFSSIFSEINLRSTSEENLPKGVSADQAGKEMKVRKFYERKMGKTTRVFVIVGGGVFNQAIDIDNALNNGEVLVQRPASELANTSTKPAAKPGIFSAPLHFPWTKTPATPIDSTKWLVNRQKTADSLKALSKINSRDSLQSKPMAKSTIVQDNPVVVKPQAAVLPNPSPNPAASPSAIPSANLSPSPIPSNPVETTPVTKPEPVYSTPNPNKTLEVQPSSTVSSAPLANPVPETAPITNESAHSVSSLLTLRPVEGPKPADKNEGSASKDTKGYEKYNKLKQLKELYDQGILTKEEFDAEKKKILSGN